MISIKKEEFVTVTSVNKVSVGNAELYKVL